MINDFRVCILQMLLNWKATLNEINFLFEVESFVYGIIATWNLLGLTLFLEFNNSLNLTLDNFIPSFNQI